MRPALLVALLATSIPAQLPPGAYLALTSGAAVDRSVQIVDRFANSSTPLVIAGIPWALEDPCDSCIEDGNNFLLLNTDLSNPLAPSQSNVYRVTYAANAWTATKLNSAPITPRAGELKRIGSTIFLSSGSPGNGSANDAMLFSMPAAGGAPAFYLGLGTACTPPGQATGTCATLTVVQTTLHILMWDGAGQQTGVEHWAVDTAQKPPVPIRVGGLLPACRRWGAPMPLLPVQATYDPNSYKGAGGALVIGGRFGEILWRDLRGNDLFHMVLPGWPPYPNYLPTELMNSCAINTDTGAVLMGDWEAHVEELIGDEYGQWKVDAQTLPVPNSARVTSLEYVPLGSSFRKVANGCFHSSSNAIPLIYLNSLPCLGNSGFAFTLEPPVTPTWVFALIGDSEVKVDLKFYGAQGCWLWPNPVVALAGKRNGAGYEAAIPIPNDRALLGSSAYVQWILEERKANPLGLVLSDSCRLRL